MENGSGRLLSAVSGIRKLGISLAFYDYLASGYIQ